MIQSFKDKETKKIWQLKLSKKIPGAIQQRALNKLNLIDQASKVEDLRIPPSNHLKALAGKGRINLAYASMISIEFALNGITELKKLKLVTTINPIFGCEMKKT
jgi:proteic killer suppression protein